MWIPGWRNTDREPMTRLLHARPRLSLVCLIGFTWGLFPCAGHSADLMDIYRLAAAQDPVFQAAAANFLADQQERAKARAALLPTISASAGTTQNQDRTIAPDVAFTSQGEADFDSDEYAINLTQTVFDYGEWVRYRQAKLTVQRSELEFAAAKQDLILRTAETYLNVLTAADSLAVSRAEKAAVDQQLELARTRLEVGLGTITDLYDAQARYSLAEARAIQADNALRDAREALRELTGQADLELARLRPDAPQPDPATDTVQTWIERAMTQNLDLLAQNRTVAIAQDEVKAQRAGHLPSLDLVASRRRNDAEGSISGPGLIRDNTDVGLELSVPLIEGGLVRAQVAQARHRLNAARKEREQLRRATDRETRAALLGVSGKASELVALEQAVTASQSALEGKTEGFQAGINSNIEVLDAQRDLFRAKRDVTAARNDYWLNLLRLHKAAGNLNEESLRRVNEWLE